MLWRRNFGQVEWNKAYQHAQAKPREQSNSDDHPDCYRSSDQGRPYQGTGRSQCECSFSSQHIGQISLGDGTDGQSEVEQCINCSEDTFQESVLDTKLILEYALCCVICGS